MPPGSPIWQAWHRAGAKPGTGARLLHAEDVLDTFVIEDGDRERTDTEWRSTYAWLSHRALAGDRLFVDTVISRGRIERDRGWLSAEICDGISVGVRWTSGR